MSRVINKARIRASRAHDKLVLAFLHKFEENNYLETEEVEEEFEKLNNEWINYCSKKGLFSKSGKEPKELFTTTITTILKKVKENESKRKEVLGILDITTQTDDGGTTPQDEAETDHHVLAVVAEPLPEENEAHETMVVKSPEQGRMIIPDPL